MKPEPLRAYVLTAHAAFEMARRGLGDDLVASVLRAPEQRIQVRPGRVVFQARVRCGAQERTCLVRVFVDTERQPPEVVTAYRTSKIAKYWRTP